MATALASPKTRPTRPRYLINGQHTLAALGQTTGGPLWLQVEEIRVDSLAQVARLYASYDRGLARTWADLYATEPGLADQALSPTVLNRLGAATTAFASGFTWQTRWHESPWGLLMRDSYVRLLLVSDWVDELTNALNGLHGPGSIRTILLRAAVLSVILVTYRFQPEHAHRFWPRVAGDNGLTVGEPAHALLRFVRETPVRRLDSATYARYVASAWNAVYAEEALRRVHAQKNQAAIQIAGTPHDGTRTLSYLTADGTVVRQPQPMEATP